MNRVLYVSKSRLESTLEEYNTIYSSVTTWRSRMETQNSNIAASNEGATTETYTEKTTAYNDNELSDFSGHVNVMSCALVEALTKTRGLIARSEDFVNILKGESAESSDTYANTSSTGDIASYYDNFCSQDGYTGAIKNNTESITDLGIKEEENLTGIEDELKHLKTISVDISGYATHIRDCITKQNYTSPLYDSLKAYCKDVADMHDYVKGIRDAYFPVLDGPREHNRSYNYDGAPTDDKENIYTSRIKELGFSERDIEVLKRYTGLTAEQLYNQLSHMPGAEIANMLKLAYANCGNENDSGLTYDQETIDSYRAWLKSFGWADEDLSDETINEMLEVMDKYNIDTKEKRCAFLAEVSFESAKGSAVYEWGDEDYFARKDYGMTYRGSGYIHITWDYGYQAFATYEILNNYPELKEYATYKNPANNGPEIIAREYNKLLDAAEELGLDISMYTDIYDKGADYVGENFAWESAAYFWDTGGCNDKLDNGGTINDVSEIINKNDTSTFDDRAENYDTLMENYSDYFED